MIVYVPVLHACNVFLYYIIYGCYTVSKFISYFHLPPGRFWMKDRSDIETIVATSSEVCGSKEEKILCVFMKGVTSPKESSSATRVRFGETRPKEFVVPHLEPFWSKLKVKFLPPLSKWLRHLQDDLPRAWRSKLL